MRISIPSTCDSSLVVQGYLRKAGYAIGDFNADYTIWLKEYPGCEVVLDATDSSLEKHILKSITELTNSHIVLHRAGGVQSDRKLMVLYNKSDAEAVEKGVFRGLLKETREVEQVDTINISKPVQRSKWRRFKEFFLAK